MAAASPDLGKQGFFSRSFFKLGIQRTAGNCSKKKTFAT